MKPRKPRKRGNGQADQKRWCRADLVFDFLSSRFCPELSCHICFPEISRSIEELVKLENMSTKLRKRCRREALSSLNADSVDLEELFEKVKELTKLPWPTTTVLVDSEQTVNALSAEMRSSLCLLWWTATRARAMNDPLKCRHRGVWRGGQ